MAPENTRPTLGKSAFQASQITVRINHIPSNAALSVAKFDSSIAITITAVEDIAIFKEIIQPNRPKELSIVIANANYILSRPRTNVTLSPLRPHY